MTFTAIKNSTHYECCAICGDTPIIRKLTFSQTTVTEPQMKNSSLNERSLPVFLMDKQLFIGRVNADSTERGGYEYGKHRNGKHYLAAGKPHCQRNGAYSRLNGRLGQICDNAEKPLLKAEGRFYQAK